MDPIELRQVGPYEVKRFIDEGAFAWVYEVVDPKFAGRRLALKLLKPEAAAGEEFRRFERESQLLAGMDHPSIVTIFDFGKDPENDLFYYTMTFVDGPTLKKRLFDGPLPVDEAAPLFIGLLDGLANLHAESIIHRDIKPANVLIGRDGRGRLSDLGIARVETERSQTRTGVAVGTALYMSPEQARGRPVDARSDIFSAGLTLYESLTGNIVYDHVEEIDSTSGMDVLIYIGRLDQQKDAEFKIVFPKEPEIPEAVKDVIRKACHLRADLRFGSAAEMRDALRDAYFASQQGAPAAAQRSGVSGRWLLAGAGVAALVVGGIAVKTLVIDPGEERIRSEALFEEVSSLEQESASLVEAAKDLVPPPGAELLREVESRQERAGEYLFDGVEDLSSAGIESANANFLRARGSFAEACDLLSSRLLTRRADAEAARMQERATGLKSLGVEEIATEGWASFQQLLPALAAPAQLAAGCDGSQVQLTRIAAADTAAQAAAALELTLGDQWPKLADQAKQNALTARKRSEAGDVRADEYRAAVRDGKREQLRGDQKQGNGDFRGARDAYETAETHYRTAEAIIPAARAQAQTRQLTQALSEEGQDIGGLVRLVARADGLYTGGDWAEAAKVYQEVTLGMRGQQDERRSRESAAGVQVTMDASRKAAITEGAQLSAAETFGEAEADRERAEQLFAERKYSEAEPVFGDAGEAYDAARVAAIDALHRASQLGDEMATRSASLLTERGCDDLGTSDAITACNDGSAALVRGVEALAALDAPTAVTAFEEAGHSLGGAQGAYQHWEETRPRPPVLTARVPKRELVEVNRNELRRFEVDASDPNGDVLLYRWSLNDEPLAAREKALEVKLVESASVKVVISDGQGGEVSESWEVAVLNRPPTLEVEPKTRSLSTKPGVPVHLSARATDPDGDPVTLEFRQKGRLVSSGENYAFEQGQPGTYTVEIVASDDQGGRTSLAKRIEVKRQVSVNKPPPAPQKKTPSIPELDDLAPYSDWRGGVVTAMKRYKQALLAADMDQLEDVFEMERGSAVRAFYERRFDRGDRIQVAIYPKGVIRGGGRRATMDFDQIEVSSNRQRTYRYRAELVRRLSGSWQIETRERR